MRVKNTGYLVVFLLLVLGFGLNSNSFADQALYDKHCGVCHTLNPDQPQRQVSYLGDIIGRDAGTDSGFSYSSGLKDLGLNWDADNLDRGTTTADLVFLYDVSPGRCRYSSGDCFFSGFIFA